jgi:tetratricopeptide (TPR) repeat protein
MVAVFGAARRRWPDTDAVVWEKNIEPEAENLRASLAWAFGDGGDDGIAIALAARLRGVVRSNLLDRRTVVGYWRAAGNKLTPETPAEDAAWLWLGLADDRSTSARAQVEAAERARGLFEALGDRQMVGRALVNAAYALAVVGDAVGVHHYANAARALVPTIPANLNKATILSNLGGANVIAGGDAADLAAAEADYAAALEIHERFNDQRGMLQTSTNLTEIQAVRGDYQSAIELATRNAAGNRSRRDWYHLAFDLTNLTSYCLLAENNGTAMRAAREALPLIADLDDQQLCAELAGSLALLAARGGALEMAASLKGYEDHYYVSNERARQTIERRVHEALMGLFAAAEADGTLSEAKRVPLMDAGAAMTIEAVLDLGRTVLAKIG